MKEAKEECLDETAKDLAQHVLKEAKEECLDETAKDLVQHVLKEAKEKCLDETAKDLAQHVLKEAKEECLDETAKDLVQHVLKEAKEKCLDETAKDLVQHVLKEIDRKYEDVIPKKEFGSIGMKSEDKVFNCSSRTSVKNNESDASNQMVRDTKYFVIFFISWYQRFLYNNFFIILSFGGSLI